MPMATHTTHTHVAECACRQLVCCDFGVGALKALFIDEAKSERRNIAASTHKHIFVCMYACCYAAMNTCMYVCHAMTMTNGPAIDSPRAALTVLVVVVLLPLLGELCVWSALIPCEYSGSTRGHISYAESRR